MKQFISGKGDSLIILAGLISEEFPANSSAFPFAASDGTRGVFLFRDGSWNWRIRKEGDQFERVVKKPETPEPVEGQEPTEPQHTDPEVLEQNCSANSDVLILKPGVTWFRLQGTKFEVPA